MAGKTPEHSSLPVYSARDNDDARKQAVAVIAATGGSRAVTLLLDALDDRSAEIRDMASEAVLSYLLQSGDAGPAGLDKAIEAGINVGEPSAAMLMLAGFSTNGGTVLETAMTQSRLVKRPPGGPVVAAAVPACLALSRRGDKAGRAKLFEIINKADKNEVLFLLDGLAMIDAPALLHQLAGVALSDTRDWQGDIPSGSDHLQYRVMDKAVDAFVARLKLQPGFVVNGHSRYSDDQIARVKKLIGERLPQ